MKKKTKVKNVRHLALVAILTVLIGCLSILGVGATGGATSGETPTVTERSAIPDGAQITGVNINGRRVLEGRVFVINGITYVPMFRFADWLGVFDYTVSSNGSILSGRIDGENLEISATENNFYISANGRYFYTVGKVMEIGGELYVPISPMVKALNSHLSVSGGAYTVRSGDTRLLKRAEHF